MYVQYVCQLNDWLVCMFCAIYVHLGICVKYEAYKKAHYIYHIWQLC